jgi:circadian clock protein KaiC
LQTLYNLASKGSKCLYVSFEESEERLRSHMRDFGWDVDAVEKKGNLKIMRIDPFKISRMVEALLAKAKGELLIELEDLYETLPHDFKAKVIVFDSLSALAAAFSGGDQNYRIYIEQLFKLFERMGVTSFLISETDQVPSSYSRTGVEEFLADGVFVFYNVKRENDRVRAIEILKLRGAKHKSKIVPFEMKRNGIVVYPTEPVFM